MTAWILAAASVALAVSMWAVRSVGPAALPPADEAPEVARLRATAQRLGAENEALRRELDRLALRAAEAPRQPSGSPAARPTDEPVRPSVSNDELARRAREKILGAAGGDDEVWGEALDALVELVNEGTEVFPVLRDIYLESSDDRTRHTLLPIMFYGGGGEEGLAFIASEMTTMEDTKFRIDMLGAVAKTIHPRVAGVFKGAFLAGLEMEDDRARLASVWGLRHVDDPDVTRALFAAATDSSEIVRRIALEALAARSVDRERLKTLIRRDPSERLREIGECTLLVADEG